VLLQFMDEDSDSEEKKNPILVVHPNYFIDT